ncbi:MAG: rhomboid family intramembrane serine protease [Caulobacterales bacterium]
MKESQADPFERADRTREPIFNAPWTLAALCIGLVALYLAQRLLMTDDQVVRLGLSHSGLAAGRWMTLFTALFLHGSWPHVLMNSAAVLAFGPPAARLLGTGPRGAVCFFGFYLTCGVVAGLGCLAVTPFGDSPLIGASGAVSGLLGAASRMMERRGHLGPPWGRTVFGTAVAWIVVNVVLGVSGLTPGAVGIQVAWQAHLAGYAAGLFLIGPFAWLAGWSTTDHAIER